MKFAHWILTCALAGSAAAQTPPTPFATNLPFEELGTLDLATGVLTPPAPIGAQPATTGVVYDNTCLPYGVPCPTPGYHNGIVWIWTPAAGETLVDDGRIPSSTSPAPNTGIMDAYRVTQFRVLFYTTELDPTLGGPGARFNVLFWDDYDRCTNMSVSAPPLRTFSLSLGGTLTAGVLKGYAVNISLVGGQEFTMKADANGAFDNSATLDNFAFGYQVTTVTPGAQIYFVTAGQPALPLAQPPSPNFGVCGFGDATYYLNSANTAGTGLDNDNTWYWQQQQTGGYCFVGPASQPWPPPNPCPTGQLCVCPNQPGPIYGGLYMRVTAELDDCNTNKLPDADDISSGFSLDVNLDGIPDECQVVPIATYCTAGTTLNNCVAAISGTGSTSVSQASGLNINVNSLEGQKQGIIFYAITFPIASPWGTSSSLLCVKAPTQRTGVQNSGGALNTCNGAMTLDFFNYLSTHPTAVGNPFSAGQKAYFQGWFRDQGSPKTTSLSDALQITFMP